MPLYGPSTATATVAANTNSVAITGMDLNAVVQQGMTISFGARDRAVGDAWIINTVVPNGTNGGTLTTAGSIPTAYNSVPFLIDTRGFNGTDSSYAAAVSLKLLATLTNLLGSATNLFAGSRQLVLDKVASTAIGRVAFAIAGRTWGDIAQRSLTYTPTGGQAVSTETLAVRAFSDGATPIDALLFDLSTGTGDLRKAMAVMAAATNVDLGSAPMGKVAITGGAGININSFGPGRHLERIGHFADGGATLIHSASLDLPGGVNIATQIGDRFHATSNASGNWRVTSYSRANGKALVPPTPAEAGAQAALGFVPVQQGGGSGQGSNKIYIGWSGDALKGAVDAVDLGTIWTDYSSSKSFAASGYHRFPNGLIIQWGRSLSTLATDYVQNLGIAYPNGNLGVIAGVEGGSANDRMYSVAPDQIGQSSFAIRTRSVANGGSVGPAANVPVRWFSWGY